ncbi:hypothetical protein V500_03889 [Pseudogymnoascus sp. VKM F-4518 (FW-2643)]|nr:hypothetical protein V500_03889 [Pseudogymnoascus sp. VKM F-4518 (FW-2643)]
MSTDKAPAEKLPLAIRKNVRDSWENKKPELEAQLLTLLGEAWTFDINPLAIYPYAEEGSYGHSSLGDCIYAYADGFIYQLKYFLAEHGEEGKTELNAVVPTHTITFGASPKFSYCGNDIEEGKLRLLFNPSCLGTNIDHAGQKLAETISAAPQPENASPLSYTARNSIKTNYDAKIGSYLEQARKALQNEKFVFDPSWEQLAAGLKGGKDVRDDWETNLGNFATSYFEGFVSALTYQKFHEDEMLREGLEEAVPNGVLKLRIVEKLTTGQSSYSEITLDNGDLVIQADPITHGPTRVDSYLLLPSTLLQLLLLNARETQRPPVAQRTPLASRPLRLYAPIPKADKMASANLPLRLRSNIRDLVTSPTSAVAIRTADLGKTIGYPVSLDPEWSILWAALQPYYADPATFIPSIARVLVSWCDVFTAWLEAEENEDGVERLLEEMKPAVKIVVEISTTGKRPSTAWLADKRVFVISLPKAEPPPAGTIHAGLSSDFLSLFTPLSSSSPHAPVSAVASDDPEWADVSIEPEIRTPAALPHQSIAAQESASDRLPDLALIPRPEELLKRAPYWLLVRQDVDDRVVIQGSHAPSLECMEAYLKRWCRGNPHRVDRPPVVEVKMEQSAFGVGLLNDTLVLQGQAGKVSVMLVLVFIETVLEYAPVLETSTAGRVWEFKRVKGFK